MVKYSTGSIVLAVGNTVEQGLAAEHGRKPEAKTVFAVQCSVFGV